MSVIIQIYSNTFSSYEFENHWFISVSHKGQSVKAEQCEYIGQVVCQATWFVKVLLNPEHGEMCKTVVFGEYFWKSDYMKTWLHHSDCICPGSQMIWLVMRSLTPRVGRMNFLFTDGSAGCRYDNSWWRNVNFFYIYNCTALQTNSCCN